MKQMYLIKLDKGDYRPAYESDWTDSKRYKVGSIVRVTNARNVAFLKKFMALVKLAYENWNPPIEETKWGIPVKSFDRFRKDLTILAGHYELAVSIKGEPKAEALSLSFEKMSAETFETVYNDVLNQVSILLKTAPEDIMNEVCNFY